MPQVTEEENIPRTETIVCMMNTLFAVAKTAYPVLKVSTLKVW